MSLWIFVKTFGDICVYYSVICAFPGLFGSSHVFFWPALLCAAGVTVGQLLSVYGKPTARFAGLLLPAAMFLLAAETLDFLVLVPPFLYVVFVIFRDHNALEYYSYSHFFRQSIIAWCIYFAVVSSLYYFEHATQPWRDSLDYGEPLLCGLIYMLCGTLVQRQLRLGQESKGPASSLQLFAVLGGVSVSVLSLVAAERFLRDRASSVLDTIRRILIVVFTAPLTLLTQWISDAFVGRFEFLEEPAKGHVQYTEPPLENGFPPPVLGSLEEQAGEVGFPWGLVVLILVAMTVVMLFMMRVLREGQVRYKTPATETLLSAEPPVSPHMERSNRAKVRQIYRKFLKQQRSCGVRLRSNQTSADILHNISPGTDAKAAAQLRAIYLAARYGEHGEITARDVAAAKTSFRNIKEKKDKP